MVGKREEGAWQGRKVEIGVLMGDEREPGALKGQDERKVIR